MDLPGRTILRLRGSDAVQRLPDRRRAWAATARVVAIAVPSLAAATALVALLEGPLGIPNASPVYLLAVVATAFLAGTAGALASAVAAILLYDFLFTHPIHTLVISDPGEWLSLILLLFVGLVVGQLTALERTRAETASSREREARELFRVSRALATRASTPAALSEIVAVLREATVLRSVWISLGEDDATERVAAAAGDTTPPQAVGFHLVLRRMPGDTPAQWVRVHLATPARPRTHAPGLELYRVRIEAAGRGVGSIWASRARDDAVPSPASTRLLAATADQVGQALEQDRLGAEARAAEIARQSDALKSALLQSVSHDLRTPLAAIRAAAGGLRPDSGLAAADRRLNADAIEREVEYLDRLVTNLLDLSRIEAGALRAELDAWELEDLAGRTLERFAARLAARPIAVALEADPVLVDPVLLDQALSNVLENALKFTPPDARIEVRAATDRAGGTARLTVDDAGPGVPDEALPRLFEKFHREAPRDRSRPGTGIGLAVVRGVVEAMGGRVEARRSALGGLSIVIELPLAHVPAELTAADR